MKPYLIFIFALLAMAGCKRKTEPIGPKYVIPAEDFKLAEPFVGAKEKKILGRRQKFLQPNLLTQLLGN